MKDIIIVGAGVIGSAIARYLSKYNLDILVLEKENDVGDGASGANSAIVHSGYDPLPGSLKAKLNVLGCSMYKQMCEELDVEYENIGSLTLANDDEECKTLDSLALRAKENGVDVKILDKDEVLKMEPNITKQVKKALYAPSAGIVNPFELVVALMENAMDNGVELHLSEEVTNIERLEKGFTVYTNKDKYEALYVINASGVYSDKINDMVNDHFFEIKARRGEYYVLDHFDNNYIHHTLFNVPSEKGKGVLVSPTTHFNYLIGPSAEWVDEKDDVKTDIDTLTNVLKQSERLVDKVNLRIDQRIREFAGNRAVSSTGDFVIEETSPFFINVSGIQSPGLTSAPAIALMIIDILKNDKALKLEEKANYNPRRRPLIRLNKKSFEERCELIKENKALGRIVCRCEQVSLGEVIDVIHRNCGARTIKGVKKRCRPGFGKCQGGFCEPIIMGILSRELGIDKEEITYSKDGSYIIKGHTKEE